MSNEPTFLDNYLTYSKGNEVPDIYHKWAGIATLSMAAGRRFWLKFHDDYVLYPHLYVLLIGSAGGRKTTAMSPAKRILRDVGELEICADSITKEALCKEMTDPDFAGVRYVKDPDTKRQIEFRQFSIFATEWVHFIASNPVGMLDFFTTVWDQQVYDARTKNMGNDLIVGPTFPILGCMTPEIMSGQLKSDLISGGFARRCCMVYTDNPGQPVAIPTKTQTQKDARELAVKQAKTIAHSTSFCGAFSWEDDTLPWYVEWYNAEFYKHQSITDDMIKSYYKSRHDIMLKVAMLLALSRGEKLLRIPYLQESINLLEEYEVNLPKVFEGAGRNEQAVIGNRMLTVIRQHKKVTKKQLMRQFFNEANSAELASIIEHLETTDQIVAWKQGDNSPTYLSTKEHFDALKTQ